jgi:hypothetical protein
MHGPEMNCKMTDRANVEINFRIFGIRSSFLVEC